MKQLGRAEIGTGSGTLIYTVPTGYRTDVNDINISNSSSSAINVAIYLVQSGGVAANSNVFIPSVSVPAKTLVQWTGTQTINEGEFIQGIASATGANVAISGDEHRISI